MLFKRNIPANNMNMQELDLLSEDSCVYKLVGPVLMKVDLEESKGNVAKRLEFIEAEVKKLDDQIAEKQGQQTAIGEEVIHVQYKLTFITTYMVY